MKFLISVLAIGAMTLLAGNYLPWWSVAIPALLVGMLMPLKNAWNFLSGFLGVSLCWLGMTWWIDSQNGGILSGRMAHVLPVGGNALYLHLLSALMGGLIAGLASLAGKYIRSSLPSSSL